MTMEVVKSHDLAFYNLDTKESWWYGSKTWEPEANGINSSLSLKAWEAGAERAE